MSHPAIRIEDLWKEYVIGARERRGETFREMLVRKARDPFRRFRTLRGQSRQADRFWALKGVNLEVAPGEVVGIVGRNGAGKTTLLKVLSRITPPTKGRIRLVGRVASLLEVGTGFHPELSGRENIYLNGAILGMNRAEINAKFDEIVDFAEVGKFLDTPVKRYSSGMYVRLAFAVAAHVEPDILLVDEVLAVGDLQFQQKCLGKMSEVGRQGRTVVFVSHNMGAVSQLCSRGVVVRSGECEQYSTAVEAIRAYTTDISSESELRKADFSGPLSPMLEFGRISVNGKKRTEDLHLSPSELVRIEVIGEAKEGVHGYRTTVEVYKDGQHVVSQHDAREPSFLPAGEFVSTVEYPPFFFSPGEYSVDFGGHSVDTKKWTWGKDQLRFVVLEQWSPEYDTSVKMGLVNLPRFGRRSTSG